MGTRIERIERNKSVDELVESLVVSRRESKGAKYAEFLPYSYEKIKIPFAASSFWSALRNIPGMLCPLYSYEQAQRLHRPNHTRASQSKKYLRKK